MAEPNPTPKLRRAWLAGYRVGDVEVLLAELRFKVSHLRDETQRLTARLSEVERHRAELEQRSDAGRPSELDTGSRPAPEAAAQPDPAHARTEAQAIIDAAQAEAARIRHAAASSTSPSPLGGAGALGTILGAQYSPAMANDSGLRRTRFRGYRRSDVEAALAHEQLVRSRLELELDAATQRANAMQLEIRDLHARIDAGREREASLSRSLDEIQQRREQTERESRHRADQLLREAEERAASLKTEGLRQVGELQGQVEALLGMRTGLTQAMQRLSEDLAAAMARIATAPATAIDYKPEDQLSRWAPRDTYPRDPNL